MADNITILDSGGVARAVATDDIGDVHFQRIKITWGPDGTANDADVASGKPLPVQLRGSAGVDVIKLIDGALGATDAGLLALGVRDDALATLTEADGDYTPSARVDSTGAQWVTLATMAQVIGSVAHDSPDTQAPVKIGMRALAHGTNPTAVAAADRTDWLASRAGVPWVIGGHPNIVTLEAAFTAAQTDTALVTIGTGLKIVVTQAQLSCDAANTVNVGARVGFGTANTPTTGGVVLTHPGLVPGGVASRGDGAGMLGVGADNEDLRITCSVPTGGSVRALVSYYTVES